MLPTQNNGVLSGILKPKKILEGRTQRDLITAIIVYSATGCYTFILINCSVWNNHLNLAANLLSLLEMVRFQNMVGKRMKNHCRHHPYMTNLYGRMWTIYQGLHMMANTVILFYLKKKHFEKVLFNFFYIQAGFLSTEANRQ